MKPSAILLLFASQAALGQPHQGPSPASPQRLRVGLRVDSPVPKVEDCFTRELRKLEDIEVVPELTGNEQLQSNHGVDTEVRVLLSENHGVGESLGRSTPPRRYSITVIVTRPGDHDQQATSPDSVTNASSHGDFISLEDSQSGRVKAAWIAVAEEKDLESVCANLVGKFDQEVVKADPTEVASVEPVPSEPDIVIPLAVFPPEPGAPLKYDVPPAVTLKVPPKYTESARRAGVQGSVELYAEINTNGRAVNVRVIRSLGFGLDEKAMDAVAKWRFTPAVKDGKPVEAGARFSVNFRLLQ